MTCDEAPGLGPAPRVGPGDAGRLWAALGLLLGFMAAEVVVGVLSRSLALISDAGHMLADAGALGLALLAMHLAIRPPSGGLTYGLRRAEILSGLVSGITLLVIAALIVFEAAVRLASAPAVSAGWMLGTALAGALVNTLAVRQLAHMSRQSLNVRGAHQHVLTDLYAFIATAIAAVVILATGWSRADAVAALLVVVLMSIAGVGLIKEAVLVLLEAAPAGLSTDAIVTMMRSHPLVVDVHDFHLWEITSGMPALSAHVLVAPGEDCHAVRRELEGSLHDGFDIDHTTLQLDHAPRPVTVRVQPLSDRSRVR
ncbi:MAG: cation transporter [Candidatus Dormibacteraeota bacterium]|nr:cation transporter [Candidatus Dormibacteraeota bacterium]